MSNNSATENKQASKHPSSDACFVVDVDNVLFDTVRLKDYLGSSLTDLVGQEGLDDFFEIWQKYYKRRDGLEANSLDKVFRKFAEKKSEPELYKKIKSIFFEKNFEEFTQDGYRDLLVILKQYGKVTVFTEGFLDFQKKKINALSLEDIVGAKNIKLFAQKQNHIDKLLSDLTAYDRIVVLEDKAEVISNFRKVDPEVVGVWIRYGYHKDKKKRNTPGAQFEVSSIKEVGSDFLQQVLGE